MESLYFLCVTGNGARATVQFFSDYYFSALLYDCVCLAILFFLAGFYFFSAPVLLCYFRLGTFFLAWFLVGRALFLSQLVSLCRFYSGTRIKSLTISGGICACSILGVACRPLVLVGTIFTALFSV